MKQLRSAVFAIGQSSWVILGLIGASYLVYFLLYMAPVALRQYAQNDLGLLLLNALIYSFAVFIVLAPMLFQQQTRERLTVLMGITKRLTFTGVGMAVMGWMAYFVISFVVALLISNVPGFNADQAQDVGFKDLSVTYEYIAAFVGLVILPPIAEELLFRGYLFGQLRQRYGFIITSLITSAVFGLVHLQWNVGIDVFILSLVLCYLRERTGSVWAGMIVHGMKNGLAYFVLFIVPLLHSNLLQ